MAKRKSISSSHTSLRLPPDLLEAAHKMGERAAWSVAKTIGHLARMGLAAHSRNSDAVDSLIADLGRAVRIQAAQIEADKIVAAARRETPLRSPARSVKRKASKNPTQLTGSEKPA